jgi:hypothetical protein
VRRTSRSTTSRQRGVGAVVALMLSLTLSLAGMTGAQADEPEPPETEITTVDPQLGRPETASPPEGRLAAGPTAGYAGFAPWTVEPTSSQASLGQMPWNWSTVGPTRFANADGVLVARPSPVGGAVFITSDATTAARSTCLGDTRTVGAVASCGTSTTTVNFPRPVVNPTIVNWHYIKFTCAGQTQTCYPNDWSVTQWMDTAVTKVNGRDPAPGQVTGVGTPIGSSFSPTTRTSSADTGYMLANFPSINASTVHIADIPRGAVQVAGTVTSITFTQTQKMQIGTNPTRSRVSGISATTASSDVRAARSDLVMTQSAPATVPSGGVVDWSLTVTNAGPSDSHGFTIKDAVPANASGAAISDAGGLDCSLTGTTLECLKPPAGFAVSTSTTVPTIADLIGTSTSMVPVALDVGSSVTVSLSGKAPSTVDTEIVSTATVAGVDIDRAPANNTSTVTTTTTGSWSILKSAVTPDDEAPSPGETIEYRVVARADAGDVPGVQLRDDLTEVLGHATFTPGSATVSIDDGPSVPVPDPVDGILTAGPYDLVEGQQAVLSYAVTVDPGAWSATMRNTVTGTGAFPPASCTPATDPAPECTTTTTALGHLLVQKLGQTPSAGTGPLDGSTFDLAVDADGAPGAVIAGAFAPVDTQVGLAEAVDLAPGTYWITETTAPDGHSLLGAPVQVTLAADGALALVSPDDHPQVTVDGPTVEVTDTPALTLPVTGGDGIPRGPALAGLALIFIAAAVLVAQRRSRPVTSAEQTLSTTTAEEEDDVLQ